jgi:hypothetical protein
MSRHPSLKIENLGYPAPFARRGKAPLERIALASSLTVVLANFGYVRAENTALGVSLIHSIWLLQFGPIEGFVAGEQTATFNLERWFVPC